MPSDLLHMVIFSLLNPATIAVGLLVGRSADQVQKVVVGAFAASVAGLIFAWLAAKVGIPVGMVQPRNVAGLFVLGWVLGGFWTWVGFRFLRRMA